MAIPASMVCECLRCGHTWIRRTEGRPVRCPKCKQAKWGIPVGKLKVGRPPNKRRAA
jgi:predicted Zn-ribbon and HTH transcriptional regulator